MKIGLLKDIKEGELRTDMTPAGVSELLSMGAEIYVQAGAGEGAGFSDDEYAVAGAVIVQDREKIWADCDFITKVKEIEEEEFDLVRKDQIIFTCIHPAAHPKEVDALLKSGATVFAAEDSHRYGSPNCEAAGKAGAFMGLWAMMSFNGGCGKYASGLGGAPGVRALVCGAGTVGKAAIEVLVNMGAHVTVAGINMGKLREVSSKYDGKVHTIYSNRYNLERILPETDLVLNCVRWPKDATEYMITKEMVESMPKGSVICDISNDYGCIETFHETTHADPIYEECGVIHYCVCNIPSAIAGSTSVAYAASLLPHFKNILENGVAEACAKDGFLRRSMVAYNGYLTHEETSGIQNRPWVPAEVILGIENRTLDPAPKPTVTVSDNYYPEFNL